MNVNRQVEVHYIDTGFPYTVTESFMDFFEGLAYSDYGLDGALHDQDNAYTLINSYKYGLSGSGSCSYYSQGYSNGSSDHILRAEGDTDSWHILPMHMNQETPTLVTQENLNSNTAPPSGTEDCICNHQNTSSSQGLQAIWEDYVDPDNMTYEELIGLGEAVGTQSRGLSQEHISLLPVSTYKCNLFSRKKNRGERCVICQMIYKRGERQMTLPCKHIYHASCVSRWLGINKACPICFTEVSTKDSRHEPIWCAGLLRFGVFFPRLWN